MNWERITLGDICHPKQWKTISTKNLKDNGYPVYGANGKIGFTDHYTHEKPTILVTCRGATCGSINVTEPYSYANGNAMALDSLDNKIVDLTFLKYCLINRGFKDVISGSAQPQITRQNIVRVDIPLPPLDEQRRIAKILDLEHKIQQSYEDKCKKYCELLKSTFVYFFGEPYANPKGFPSCTLGDLIHFAKDGPHVSPEYSDSDGIPFLSTRHVRPGEIIWDDMKFINQEEANKQWKKCKPIKGDILYTKGGTTGLATEVKTNSAFAVWVHIALLRPNTFKVHPTWLESMLNTNYAYFQSQRYTHGIANKDLGLKRMKKIKLYLPPLSEQLKFVSFVRNHEKNKKLVSHEQSQINEMISSTQSNLFSINK